MGKKKSRKSEQTLGYIVVVEFHNEVHDATDTIEYVIFAKSFAEAEKRVSKEVGKSFIRILGIETMYDIIPVFD